ncbi:hypothetical protein DRO69_03780 [Candidatus Bathyarchaeota archaeon]|nr:MAG: hypothetical protein DRO69_03780 [Candidatus Bathyarchaeota archaeon]
MLATFITNLAAQIGTETLIGPLFTFIVGLIVLSLIFYIAGRIVVGGKRALFSDAFVISLLGTIVMNVCLYFFGLLVGAILSLIVWLLLIRHYYETGWLGAIAVGIMAVIVSVVITIILRTLLKISITLLGSFSLFLIL